MKAGAASTPGGQEGVILPRHDDGGVFVARDASGATPFPGTDKVAG